MEVKITDYFKVAIDEEIRHAAIRPLVAAPCDCIPNCFVVVIATNGCINELKIRFAVSTYFYLQLDATL